MKKIFNGFFAFLLISIGLVACNSGGSSGAASGDAYTIKMKLDQGDHFTYNVLMNMDMNTSGISMKMKMDMGSQFDVLSATPAQKEIKITYNKATMGMDMGAMNTPAIDNAMKKVSDRLVGKSVTLVVSPENKITEVKGLDSMMSDPSDPQGQEMMKNMFSKDQMNNMYGMIFSMYPPKPVKIGESWTSENTIGISGMEMLVKMKYTLKAVKDGIADVAVDGIVDGKGNMTRGATKIDMNMTGTQKGMLNIKMDDGRLKSGNYTMDVKADMEMMGNKIPMTMKADYVLSSDK